MVIYRRVFMLSHVFTLVLQTQKRGCDNLKLAVTNIAIFNQQSTFKDDSDLEETAIFEELAFHRHKWAVSMRWTDVSRDILTDDLCSSAYHTVNWKLTAFQNQMLLEDKKQIKYFTVIKYVQIFNT